MREEGGLGEEPKSARDWNLGASAAEEERAMNKWNIIRSRRRERIGWMDTFISQHHFYLIAKFPSLETFR